MYDLGRRLRSFKAQMWHKCGSYKAKWWGVFMLWIIIVTHICFYFYFHATNEHEKCFRIIKILHENKWYYISISYSRATLCVKKFTSAQNMWHKNSTFSKPSLKKSIWSVLAIYVSTLQKIECIKGIWRNFHFMEEIETFWISF